MNRQERLAVKGLMAEKKERLSELETKMIGYALTIRDALPTYLDTEAYKTQAVLDNAVCLHKDRQEYDTLKAELQKLREEWGDL